MNFQNVRWRNGDITVGKKTIYFKDYLLQTEDSEVIEYIKNNMKEFVAIEQPKVEEIKIKNSKKSVQGTRTSMIGEENNE